MSDEVLKLNIDEQNDVLFKVKVEGNDGSAQMRLVCHNGELDYVFHGKRISNFTAEDLVQFVIPPMKGRLAENSVFNCHVEVIVDGRVFTPLQFNAQFERPLKVYAETFQVQKPQVQAPKVTASISEVKVEKKAVVEHTPKVASGNTLRDKFGK